MTSREFFKFRFHRKLTDDVTIIQIQNNPHRVEVSVVVVLRVVLVRLGLGVPIADHDLLGVPGIKVEVSK